MFRNVNKDGIEYDNGEIQLSPNLRYILTYYLSKLNYIADTIHINHCVKYNDYVKLDYAVKEQKMKTKSIIIKIIDINNFLRMNKINKICSKMEIR